jgi:hypothetical protein
MADAASELARLGELAIAHLARLAERDAGPPMVVKMCDPCGCAILLEHYDKHGAQCSARLAAFPSEMQSCGRVGCHHTRAAHRPNAPSAYPYSKACAVAGCPCVEFKEPNCGARWRPPYRADVYVCCRHPGHGGKHENAAGTAEWSEDDMRAGADAGGANG